MPKEASACPPCDDPVEIEFRRKNQWHSFTSSLAAAVGTASFIGALGTLAKSLVDAAVSMTPEGIAASAAATASGAAQVSAMATFGLMPMMAIGGLVALGVAALYVSQTEYTEARCLQDAHLAHLNAKQMHLDTAPAPAQTKQAPIYEQNKPPASGKTWVQVSRTDIPQAERYQGAGLNA